MSGVVTDSESGGAERVGVVSANINKKTTTDGCREG